MFAIVFLDKLVKRACDAFVVIAALLALFMALFGTTDIVSTFLFVKPIPIARELSQVLLAVVIFGSMAIALREDRHVAVDLFIGSAPAAVKRASRILSLTLGAGVFLVFALRSSHLAEVSIAEREVALALIRFPIWPAKLAVAIAMFVTFAEYVRQLAWAIFAGDREYLSRTNTEAVTEL